MKITKRQLRRILKEAISLQRLQDLEGRPHTDLEFQRDNSEASRAVDKSRPWGSDAVATDDTFSDYIIMSPNGDSVLVDGLETYIDDVPSQLEHVSGFPVPDMIGDVMVTELENQRRSGYIEMAVKYKNGKWTGSWS